MGVVHLFVVPAQAGISGQDVSAGLHEAPLRGVNVPRTFTALSGGQGDLVNFAGVTA